MADKSSIDPPLPPPQQDGPSTGGPFAPGGSVGDIPPIHDEPAAAAMGRVRSRRWITWVSALALLIAACAMALWLGKLITTERTLRSVERAATATPAPLEVAAADGLPAAAGVTPGNGTVDASANVPADVRQAQPVSTDGVQAQDAVVPVAAGATAGGAIAPAAAAPAVSPAPVPATSGASTVGDVGSSQAAVPVEREAVRKAPVAKKEGKRSARQAKRAPAKVKKARNDTFKRCPPLGKSGAVMCRWHICNGAAGKEKVCRPYLERKP